MPKHDHSTIYVATGDAFCRIEYGRDNNWISTLTLEGRSIQCIAVDPMNSATVYAGSRGSGVWKSRDGGQQWQQLLLAQKEVTAQHVGLRNMVD